MPLGESVSDAQARYLAAAATGQTNQPVSLPTGTGVSRRTTADTNAVVWRGSACSLQEITLSNPTATPAFLKLYNRTAVPNPAVDQPLIIIPIPASSSASLEFGNVGKRFSLGLAIAVTGAIGELDATAAPVGVLLSATYL